jgi:hypothetical protein
VITALSFFLSSRIQYQPELYIRPLGERRHEVSRRNTECNRTRYATLKKHSDQTNSNITNQLVTEHLLTFQVLRHFKSGTHGHHYVTRCGRPSKWRTLLMWRRRSVCWNSNKTIQRHWSNGGFVRILVKEHLRGNPFTSDTSRLLKQVACVLRRIIRADDQVARLWSPFVSRFSAVRRNPQGGKIRNLVMSRTWQYGGCYVRDFFPDVQISIAAGVKAQ